MRKALALALPLSCLLGCASQKDLVAKATSYHRYFEYEYEQECVVAQKRALAECKQRYLLLETLRAEATVCNEAQKIGPLPKPAIQRLEALLKELEK